MTDDECKAIRQAQVVLSQQSCEKAQNDQKEVKSHPRISFTFSLNRERFFNF